MNDYDPLSIAQAAIKKGAIQKVHEFAIVLQLLKSEELRVVLEIGTFEGGTLWAWAQIASPDAVLASIDLPGGSFGGGYAEEHVATLRSYVRPTQELHLIRADSHLQATLDDVQRRLGGREIDLLFVDGDHTYPGVRRDYEMYGPLVRKGGLVLFHDIMYHGDPQCQVQLFWRQVKRRCRYVETVEAQLNGRDDPWGLGLIYYSGVVPVLPPFGPSEAQARLRRFRMRVVRRTRRILQNRMSGLVAAGRLAPARTPSSAPSRAQQDRGLL